MSRKTDGPHGCTEDPARAPALGRLLGRAIRLLADRAGTTAMTMAVLTPCIFGAVGCGIDYAKTAAARADLQKAADASALAGAKEFRLSSSSAAVVADVASRTAKGSLGSATNDLESLAVTPTVDMLTKKVQVRITAVQPTYFLRILGTETLDVTASATATVLGGPPICVIGLDTEATSTVELDGNARLDARGCSVYSNSVKPNGLKAQMSSSLTAAFICSAGGKLAGGAKSFVPEPQTDCPILPDPMASRELPTPLGCNQVGLQIRFGIVKLLPGTYCGGLLIDGPALVTLSPGIYIFKDGALKVSGGATLKGDNVGLYFTGNGATIDFQTFSSISLSAPRDGLMAGLLVAEDRTSPEGQTHQILSNDARNLLGTIYLPQGRLYIAAARPIADQSAYTIVVARRFSLAEGPTMVLNADYDATDIPVPKGVGPNANHTALTE